MSLGPNEFIDFNFDVEHLDVRNYSHDVLYSQHDPSVLERLHWGEIPVRPNADPPDSLIIKQHQPTCANNNEDHELLLPSEGLLDFTTDGQLRFDLESTLSLPEEGSTNPSLANSTSLAYSGNPLPYPTPQTTPLDSFGGSTDLDSFLADLCAFEENPNFFPQLEESNFDARTPAFDFDTPLFPDLGSSDLLDPTQPFFAPLDELASSSPPSTTLPLVAPAAVPTVHDTPAGPTVTIAVSDLAWLVNTVRRLPPAGPLSAFPSAFEASPPAATTKPRTSKVRARASKPATPAV
ncbi:hypothetical protein HK104_001883, partial [Borealophlyctis nickersoniae]